ncbi:MAG TPA: tannase/feruloyl esterase family alpha/beta hydrolase [Vicinamibacterales bacterium]|nr:tannase/feruloyl esterase family alpha/beta hydrolase [Vicinamibacterales bacterium]
MNNTAASGFSRPHQIIVPVLLAVLLATIPVRAQAPAEHHASPSATSTHGCEALASLALPQAKVTSAQLIAAGAFTAPEGGRGNAAFAQLPAFCRVAATLTPSADSQIQMEIWLPAENWNGKFLAVGNGGWAGTISRDAIAAGLRRGYAAASNDTGHSDASAGAQFALNQDKLVDFAYRAMHEMTVQSKSIVNAFYSRPPRLSYYQGCSTGGRQGMMEAQRYPDDFDAIIAGAPVYNMVHMNVSQTALQVHMLKNPERIVPQSKVTLLANAVVGACDANDGVKDNIINNPRACKFDPGTLACKAGDSPDCLTAAQVETAKQFYLPVKTKSGEVVYPGRSPGVESGYAARIPVVGKPVSPLWGDMPRFVGHRDANWDTMSFDLDKDLALTLKNASFIEASNPDLAKFKARGGKLLLWHGWADPGPAPENTINYYSHASKASGGGATDDWMRLFLLPGVAHCGGGVGPDQADFLGAMERWREQGVAPAQITASRNAGRGGLTPMTRPLCPFPQVARYKGSGSTDEAANFVCAAP